MMKLISIICSVFMAQTTFAETALFDYTELQRATMVQAELTSIDWQVGDRADYNIDMGFIKGTMVMSVREWVAEGPWVEQNVEMMGQKQKVEILFDKTDGSIIKLIVNGQKQEVPANNSEIVDMKEDNINVPAGNFDCIYAKILNKDDNKTSEAWINPTLIPIAGLVQQKAPTQFGTMTMQLTGFQKN